MPDTISRLAGPTVPLKAEAGTLLYTPAAGTRVAIKNALLMNSDPLAGVWAILSIGATATLANRFVPSVYVPPKTVMKVPLDLVVSGDAGDTIRARQIVDMTYTQMTVALAVAQTADTTNATSYATASWSSVAGTAYAMFVTSTHATAAEVPSGFTETHTGITWTQVSTKLAVNGTTRITAYRAQASGVTAATTTATFSGTMTGVAIAIAALTGGDVSGTNGDEAVQAGGTWHAAATGTAHYLPGTEQCGGRYAMSALTVATTYTAGTGFLELGDTTHATPAMTYESEYALTPGADASSTAASTGVDRIMSMVNIQDTQEPLSVILNGVIVT